MSTWISAMKSGHLITKKKSFESKIAVKLFQQQSKVEETIYLFDILSWKAASSQTSRKTIRGMHKIGETI